MMTGLMASRKSPGRCNNATGRQPNIAACWLAHIFDDLDDCARQLLNEYAQQLLDVALGALVQCVGPDELKAICVCKPCQE